MSKTKHPLDSKKLTKIYVANSKAVIGNVFGDAVELALRAKHGPGILSRAQISDADVTAMYEAMWPLRAVLEHEATMSFVRVFSSALGEPELRNYLLTKTAAILGKTGGRKKGKGAAHTVWLESAMRSTESAFAARGGKPTAKEHMRVLLMRHEIRGEDDEGNLEFTERQLDEFRPQDGQKEPVVTRVAVRKMLTRIRQAR